MGNRNASDRRREDARQSTAVRIFLRNNWIFIAEIVITISLCVVHAAAAGHYVNFSHGNGTFQNFNPVRRFLSGQVPYQDFQDYLGLGHLYVGSFATALFGGNYKSSLIAFSFLTFGTFAALNYMVSFALIKQKEKSSAIANIVLAMILIQPFFFSNAVAGTQDIYNALVSALGTGNSARLVRGLILPIDVLLIWLAYLAYVKIAERHTGILNHKDLVASIGVGLIAGFGFAWSNDYGISCWVCLFIMTFWVSICRHKNFLKSLLYAGIELTASLAGLFVAVEIFTAGHFFEWLRATFGTGRYQSWYYNSSKSYYLYDVDFSYIMLIQAGISIVYLIKLFKEYKSKEELQRYGILAFANMVCFCAVNEYKLLSGDNSREVALSVLFLTVLYELFKLCNDYWKRAPKKYTIIVVSAVVCLSWIIDGAKREFIFKHVTDLDGTYIDALGGNLTALGNDLIETEEFLGGENFFATYASAQEVVNNSFQPSGTDYIIHVLGDQQRQNYMSSFNEGDFKYAATMKETYSDWEYWVLRANWFFYRELYQNWHPVYANTYEVFWERNPNEGEHTITGEYDVDVIDINEYSKKIVIKCDEAINGIADVYVDANAEIRGGLSSKLVFTTMLRVENIGTIYAGDAWFESNYLRPAVKEYIPMPIINGYGEVLLSSQPQRNTVLILREISCDRIFTVMSDFVEISGASVDSSGRVIFHVLKSSRNRDTLANLQSVEFLGKQYSISEISEDNNSLYIITDEIIDAPLVEAGHENYLVLKR